MLKVPEKKILALRVEVFFWENWSLLTSKNQAQKLSSLKYATVTKAGK